MKKLIVIVLVLLLGGGAAWWFLLRESPEDSAETEVAAAPPTFLDLEPFIVPVVRDSGVSKLIKIDLALEVKGEGAATTEEGLPRLTDAFVTELYGLFGYRQMEERQYDLAIVKRRLQNAADRALGEGEILAVLVQGIALAPVR
jgi:hypothetical protein